MPVPIPGPKVGSDNQKVKFLTIFGRPKAWIFGRFRGVPGGPKALYMDTLAASKGSHTPVSLLILAALRAMQTRQLACLPVRSSSGCVVLLACLASQWSQFDEYPLPVTKEVYRLKGFRDHRWTLPQPLGIPQGGSPWQIPHGDSPGNPPRGTRGGPRDPSGDAPGDPQWMAWGGGPGVFP